MLKQLIAGMRSPRCVNKVISRHLTYLDRGALNFLAREVARIERGGIAGELLECGTALGGSAIVMASFKRQSRTMRCYDVFGMIPPPSERDGADVHKRYEEIVSGRSEGIGGDKYYGYETDLRRRVESSFAGFGLPLKENNIELIQGLYENTLHPVGPVALAHIDCDWYDPVLTCLERIVPVLSQGGALIIDDYFAYTGCRAAVWDYFRQRLDEFSFVYGSRLRISRKTAAVASQHVTAPTSSAVTQSN